MSFRKARNIGLVVLTVLIHVCLCAFLLRPNGFVIAATVAVSVCSLFVWALIFIPRDAHRGAQLVIAILIEIMAWIVATGLAWVAFLLLIFTGVLRHG